MGQSGRSSRSRRRARTTSSIAMAMSATLNVPVRSSKPSKMSSTFMLGARSVVLGRVARRGRPSAGRGRRPRRSGSTSTCGTSCRLLRGERSVSQYGTRSLTLTSTTARSGRDDEPVLRVHGEVEVAVAARDAVSNVTRRPTSASRPTKASRVVADRPRPAAGRSSCDQASTSSRTGRVAAWWSHRRSRPSHSRRASPVGQPHPALLRDPVDPLLDLDPRPAWPLVDLAGGRRSGGCAACAGTAGRRSSPSRSAGRRCRSSGSTPGRTRSR